MYHYRHPKQGSEGIMLQRWLAALFPPRVPACRPLGHLVTATPAFPVHAHFTARAEHPHTPLPVGPSATQITRSRTRG